MRLFAVALIPALLAQVPGCDGIPSGDIEYKDCLAEDQREGYTCKAIYVGGKLLRKVYSEIKQPTPVPTVSPSSSPQPEESPTPSPTAPPSTPPDDEEVKIEDDLKWCVVQDNGKFPLPVYDPEEGPEVFSNTFCPTCWQDPKYADELLTHWGIADHGRRPMDTPTDPYIGFIQRFHITPHSAKKFLPHRTSGSEMWAACQFPPMDERVPDVWLNLPNGNDGLADQASRSRYHKQHKPKRGEEGPTRACVMHPKGQCITVQIP